MASIQSLDELGDDGPDVGLSCKFVAGPEGVDVFI